MKLNSKFKRRNIAITGIELFAKRLVQDLNLYIQTKKLPFIIFYIPPSINLNTIFLLKADIIHFIGGNIFLSKGWKFLGLKLLVSFNKKVVIHWVGSDVLRLNKINRNIKNITHLCEVNWIQNELKIKGIEAKEIPMLGVNIDRTSLQDFKFKEFSILTYMGKNRESFYGLEEFIHLAEYFPYIKIKVIGTDCKNCNRKKIPKNLQFLGWVTNVKILMKSSPVYVRFVKHDGLSISVLEALSLGRHVCYNFPLKGTYYTPTLQSLKVKIEELYIKFIQKRLMLNLEGIKVVEKYYSKPQVYNRIIEFYKDLLK